MSEVSESVFRARVTELEGEVAALSHKCKELKEELVQMHEQRRHHESQLEEARWLLGEFGKSYRFTEGEWIKWEKRRTAWLSAHTPTGKEK